MKNDYYGFIYMTTNNINNMKYIGKKVYNGLKIDTYLGSGIHLKRAISKYGKDNFSRITIENCFSGDDLNEREKYWINFYDAVNSLEFYNIASGGDGGNVISGFSEEERLAYSNTLSLARKGIINLSSKNHCAKKVICLNTMEIFNCIADSARKYNICPESIGECCNNPDKNKTAGIDLITRERLQWRFYFQDEAYEFIPYKRDYTETKKRVMCLNTKDIFPSTVEAANKYGISCCQIRHCCTGRTKIGGRNPVTGEKLYWKYLDD